MGGGRIAPDPSVMQEAVKKENQFLDLWASRAAQGHAPSGTALDALPWDPRGEVAVGGPGNRQHMVHLCRAGSTPELWTKMKVDPGHMLADFKTQQSMLKVPTPKREAGGAHRRARGPPPLPIDCPWGTDRNEPSSSVYLEDYKGANSTGDLRALGLLPLPPSSKPKRPRPAEDGPVPVITREAPFAASSGAPTEFYRRIAGPVGEPLEDLRLPTAPRTSGPLPPRTGASSSEPLPPRTGASSRPPGTGARASTRAGTSLRSSGSAAISEAVRTATLAAVAPYVDLLSADGRASTVIRPNPGASLGGSMRRTAQVTNA